MYNSIELSKKMQFLVVIVCLILSWSYQSEQYEVKKNVSLWSPFKRISLLKCDNYVFLKLQTLIQPRKLNRVPQEVKECLKSHSTAIFSLERFSDIDFNIHSCVYCGNPKCIENDSSIECKTKHESSHHHSSQRSAHNKNFEQDIGKLDDAIKNFDTDEGRQILYQQTKLVESALVNSYQKIETYTAYNPNLGGMHILLLRY